MPPRFKTLPRNLFAHENADVELQCDVDGVPRPTIKWMKDGDPLIPSDYFQVRSPIGLETRRRVCRAEWTVERNFTGQRTDGCFVLFLDTSS